MKISSFVISSLLIGMSVPAFAQVSASRAPSFAPFEVTQQDYAALHQFLSEQPYRVAAPVISYLDSKEKAALMTQKATKHPLKHEGAAPSKGK